MKNAPSRCLEAYVSLKPAAPFKINTAASPPSYFILRYFQFCFPTRTKVLILSTNLQILA